jgi:hypothetical protein
LADAAGPKFGIPNFSVVFAHYFYALVAISALKLSGMLQCSKLIAALQ